MKTWTDQISTCIEDENKRQYLNKVPLVLLTAAEYTPPWWYWLDYAKLNLN